MKNEEKKTKITQHTEIESEMKNRTMEENLSVGTEQICDGENDKRCKKF